MTLVDYFGFQELDYFKCQYPKDLNHLYARHGVYMSLMIFTDTKHPPPLREWTEHFALIKSRSDFLFCLFFHVLINQSLHFTGQRENVQLWLETSGYVDPPKLRGILASAHTHISPFFLLVSATLWVDPEADTQGKLVSYSRLFRDYCKNCDIPYDFLITHAIAQETHRFADDYHGFARSAYFSNRTPDMQLLEAWSSLLVREFGLD